MRLQSGNAHYNIYPQKSCSLCDICFLKKIFNSLRPSDAYMCPNNIPTLFQIMACRLTGASHYLNQCWNMINWTPGEQISMQFSSKIQQLSCKNVHSKMSSGKWRPFYLALNVLKCDCSRFHSVSAATMMTSILPLILLTVIFVSLWPQDTYNNDVICVPPISQNT